MRLIFLWGAPAVGKLTVAKELQALTKWRLFDNHLVVDTALSVFDFGTPQFVQMRESIWNQTFALYSTSGGKELIFTFNPENSVPQSFIDNVVSSCSARGDELVLVELYCSEENIEQRIGLASRHEKKKLTSLEFYRKLRDDGVFTSPVMPPSHIRVDTSKVSAAEAAARILEQL